MAKELRNLLGQVFFPFRPRQDPEQQQEFLKCCQKNDLKGVESRLSLKVDVNTVSEDGCWSGLTIAAHKGKVHLFCRLLGLKKHRKTQIKRTKKVEVLFISRFAD